LVSKAHRNDIRAFILSSGGRIVGQAMELDDIGDAEQSQFTATEPQPAGGADALDVVDGRLVYALVQHAALGGQGVFRP
jgi:hypothetical protein